MKRWYSVVSLVVIVCLAAVGTLCAKGVLEALVMRSAGSWLADRPTLYTMQLSDESRERLVGAVQAFAQDHPMTVVSHDSVVRQSGATLYTFGVLASSAAVSAVEPLDVLGTPVVDDAVVSAVVSGAPGAYAGFGNNAFDRVQELPSIRAGAYFRVQKLDSAAVVGSSCTVLGLSDEEFQALLADVATATGCSGEALTEKTFGSVPMAGLFAFFSAGAFLLLALGLSLLLVARSLLELKTLGVRLMLGWGAGGFLLRLFRPQLAQLLAVVPVCLAGTALMLSGFGLTAPLAAFVGTIVAAPVVAVLLSLALAALPILLVKPVDAICARYSRRGFYVLAAGVYLVTLAAVFGGSLYINQPLAMYTDLARTRSVWSAYEDWWVVKDLSVDGQHFVGDAMAQAKDVYDWYAAHEDDEGVYLSNVSYTPEVDIEGDLPDAAVRPVPFWYLAASPSYLEQAGVELSPDVLAKVRQGVRVYLLPSSLSAGETEALKSYLLASRKPWDSNIVTEYMKHPSTEFVPYDGAKGLFTWATHEGEPAETSGMVIAVLSAENMVPFESESLVASGLNSYLKLDGQAASQLLDNDSVALNSGLDLRFATVGNFIDGMKKLFEELFFLFGIVLAMLVIIVAVMVLCIVEVVNRVSAREVSVKCVLGFGPWTIYRREFLFVNIATLTGVAVSALAQSTAGLLMGGALLVASNLLIVLAARRRSVAVVLETVSKEQ